MSALLERYERQATLLQARSDLRDVQALARRSALLNARRWKAVEQELREGGELTAVGGPFAALEVTPTVVNAATVTGGATELVMIPTSLLAIPANPQVPKLYRLFASGTSTTAATPGTFTFSPRIGPSPTNASPLIGATTGNITPVASATAAQWRMEGFLLIRTGGAAAVAVGSFEFNMSATVGGGGPASATSNAVFGGVSASFDSTAATALWIGVTHATSTTNTWVPQLVAWGSWN